jgi:ubiquinone biosynthesis protein
VTVLNIPLFAFFVVLTVLLLALGLRRLMGMTLSPLRLLIAALIALFSASPIITAMAGSTVSSKHPGLLPGLWFVLLGVVIAMLVGMLSWSSRRRWYRAARCRARCTWCAAPGG